MAHACGVDCALLFPILADVSLEKTRAKHVRSSDDITDRLADRCVLPVVFRAQIIVIA